MNGNTTTHNGLANTVRSAAAVLLAVFALIVFAGDAQAILLEGLDANGGRAVTAEGVHYTASHNLSSADDTVTAAVQSIICGSVALGSDDTGGESDLQSEASALGTRPFAKHTRLGLTTSGSALLMCL